MFGFSLGGSKAKAESPATRPNTDRDEFAALDADLDDPELLRELAELTGVKDLKKTANVAASGDKQKKAQQEVDVDEILATIPNQPTDDIHVEVHDHELDDPELLGELEQLGLASGSVDVEDYDISEVHDDVENLEKKATPRKQHKHESEDDDLQDLLQDMRVNKEVAASQMGADLSTAIIASTVAITHGVKAPLKAGEETDEEDLKPLIATIVGGNTKTEATANTVENAASTAETSDMQVDFEGKLQTKDISQLNQFINNAKTEAIMKRKSGDDQGAREALKRMKMLQSQLEQVSTGVVRQSSQGTIPRPPSSERTSSKEELAATSSSATSSMLDILKKRQFEYKQAALTAKKENNLPRARELISISKTLDSHIESLALGGSLPQNFQLPPPPSHLPSKTNNATKLPSPIRTSSSSNIPPPIKTVTSPTKAPSTRTAVVAEALDFRDIVSNGSSPATNDSQSSGDIFTVLEKKLSAQIETCTTLSAYHYKRNQKDQALEYHRHKKSFQNDIEALSALKKSNSAPPKFNYRELRYEIIQEFADIPLDEMRVDVVRAFDLGVSATDETYVSVDIGWPTEEGKESEGKFDTGRFRGLNPEYDFKKSVKITRTRAFQRWVERKKATFEVWQYGGWLRKSKAIGKVTVPVCDLAEKCELHQVVDLAEVTNPKRLAGGKLEIRIRLRQPLLKTEVIQKVEKWVFVDFGTTGATPSAISVGSPATKTTESSKTAQPSQASKQSGSRSASPNRDKPTIASPAVLSLKPQPASPAISAKKLASPSESVSSASSATSAATEERLIELLSHFEAVEDLVSNEVLEFEKGLVEAQIAQFKVKGAPAAGMQQEAEFKLQGILMKLDLLVMQVQSGQLTMQAYAQKLKVDLPKQKTFAREFSKVGRKDLAMRALQRVKLMEKEINEIEASMAE